MCPKMQSSPNGERGTGLKTMCQNNKLTSALWSFCQEDKHDSGFGSMNLPSLNLCGIDNVSSIESAFSNMKINSELQTSHHDYGVYTNGQSSSRGGPGAVNIDTLYETECEYKDNDADNSCDSDDIAYDSGRNGRIQLHIRSEQVAWLFEADKDGDNKLHLSIINGSVASSRLIINIAPEYDCLNLSNHLRQTPLHLAVLTRQPKIVRRLICAGATVLAQDKQGDTPLHIACRLGDTETVKHLLTPVQYEETLENRYSIPYQRVPQDLRVRNYEGQTCLHIAASSGHHIVVQMLLEAGADINMGDSKSGRSVLHMAADRGDAEMVMLLLSYRNINVKNQDYAGVTPIQLAYGRNHMSVVNIICSLSGKYDGVHLSDPEISLEDEDDLDDSDVSDCCDAVSAGR